ncbi:MAG: PASTA domain-containing protein [Cyclobacteriaceae bacterium]|jgi:beta-lactam-binding protein with PASTA domain|nr:PASTA domain-containing protein [Cyclobacteriaceae bacterium]
MQNPFKKYKINTLGGLLLSLGTALILFMLIGLSYFYIYLPSSTNHGETITVPDVSGMKMSDLEEFLSDRNLRFVVNDSSYTEDKEPNIILKQFPVAGAKVKENRVIYLTKNSSTPPTVPVPDLVDGSLINAEAVLKGSGLKRGKIIYVPGPFPVIREMRVNNQKIIAGARVPKGSFIDLYVEDGGNNEFGLPNIVGQELDEAEELLFGLVLQFGEIIAVGDTTGLPANVILQQDPQPKTIMRPGDAVKIWVGKPGTILEGTNN